MVEMTSIFLSYRREDSRHQTGRLHDRLVAHFGPGQVFKDVDSIPLGRDFREVLTERVAACDVFLAIIGDGWLSITGKDGIRRLDDPGDFVRIEIEAALSRQIPVIPVLVGSSSVPRAEELPESLGELSFRHGLTVRPDPDFHHDVDRLIRGIEDGASTQREASTPRGPKTHRQKVPKSADKESRIEPRVGSSSRDWLAGTTVSIVGLLNVVLGLLATFLLSLALFYTLGLARDSKWAGFDIAELVCFATGIIFGVFQIFAGLSLMGNRRSARRLAIRHAKANLAVLVLFYLFGLTVVPKNHNEEFFFACYVFPLFILIISCPYPAAVWFLLSRRMIRSLFRDEPKASLTDE
jgi:hypothetical protein